MRRTVFLAAGVVALAAGVLQLPGAVAGAQTRPTPVLSIHTDHRHYGYHTPIRLSVHLGTTGGNRTVSILEKVPGRAATVIDRDDSVDANGDLVGSIPAVRNATYSVRFDGDSSYAPRTASAPSVVVAVDIVSVLSGNYTMTGRYELYHVGSNARYDVGVAPGKARQQVNFPLQMYYRHHWHTVSNRSATLSSGSLAGITFTARRGIYRIATEFHGDSTNGGRRCGWRYLKFL